MNWFKKIKQEDLVNNKKIKVQPSPVFPVLNVPGGLREVRDESNKKSNDESESKRLKLKISQPINIEHQAVSSLKTEAPLTTEQWEMITNECSLLDGNKNLCRYSLTEIEAMRSFVPKDKKQEAQQVFAIAQFAKEHEIEGMFCLNSNIYGQPQSVKINKENNALHLVNDLKVQFINSTNDNRQSVRKGMLLPKSLSEHPVLKKMDTHNLEAGNEENGNLMVKAAVVNDYEAYEATSNSNWRDLENKEMKFDEYLELEQIDLNENKISLENSVIVNPKDKVLAIPDVQVSSNTNTSTNISNSQRNMLNQAQHWLGHIDSTVSLENKESTISTKSVEIVKDNESQTTLTESEKMLKKQMEVQMQKENKDGFEKIVYQSMCPGGMLINIKISKSLTAPYSSAQKDV